MDKLTMHGQPGGLIRFVSTADRHDLVQKLGEIEHEAGGIFDQVCDRFCRYPYETEDQEDLNNICKNCPLTRLADLIGV